jgi:predicted ATPase
MRLQAEGPAAMTGALFGRSGERERIVGLLARVPLVTITGLPGVGKTAMALEVAAATAADFPDGVWPVSLGDLADPGLVPHVIGMALALPERLDRTRLASLVDQLHDRCALLVLDTCEHLTVPCAQAASALLAGCPDLRIIATSRRPLNMVGEHVLTLPPLEDADAVDLFFARARAVVPDLRITAADREQAAVLCRKLDGLPLAIELAARRLAHGGVARLSADLDHLPLHDLGTGGDGRHDSLAHAIGWSHQIGTPSQRLLWARLSVFPGAFESPDAAFVCAGRALPEALVEETLLDLADSALLRIDRADDGGISYRMPRMLRAYGAHMLQLLGEETELHDRYRQWESGRGR